MLCVNAPRKPMARIHMLISLVLVIVCTVLAFTPLMTIRVTDETVDSIESLMEYVMKSDDESETNAAVQKALDSMKLKNATVKLSFKGVADATKPIADASAALSKFIEAAMNSSNGKTEEEKKANEQKMKDAAKELKSVFLTDDGEIRSEVRDLVVVLAAIAGPMLPSTDDIEGGMSEDDVPAMLSKAIPHMIGLILALILLSLLPIIYVILALVTLITFLKNLRTPDIGAAKLAKRMPKSIVHPLSIVLLTCLTATLGFTTNTLIMIILAAVGTLVNVIFTRLHSWEKEDIAYANAVQATTLVSIGAYLFLFFNILKMGVFKTFIGRLISFFVSDGKIGTAVYTDIAMIFVAVLFAFVSTKYLAKVLRRISLACKPKRKGGARATHLVYALFLMLVTIFPMMALGSTANNGGAFLVASPAQEYALLYGFIATGIMVLSEIVLLILRKVFGKRLTPAEVADVLSGVSQGPEDPAPSNDEPEVIEVAQIAEGEATEESGDLEEVEKIDNAEEEEGFPDSVLDGTLPEEDDEVNSILDGGVPSDDEDPKN